MKNKIEIPLSKSKLSLLLVGAVIFVLLGLDLLLSPDKYTTSFVRNPAFVVIPGILAILFFGLCMIVIGRKLFDTKLGLIIDDHGITDNSSSTGVGLIEWTDIEGMDVLKIASTKIILLYTSAPDKYLARPKTMLGKQAAKANLKSYGTPLSISSSSLKIGFAELEGLIRAEIEKRNSAESSQTSARHAF